MTRNMGNVDRAVRVVIGIILIALVFVGPKTPWGWLGLIPLATAALGYCPPYAIFGINTSGKDKAS
jgi:ABC-type polysaccharide/polyol phosphate export permease